MHLPLCTHFSNQIKKKYHKLIVISFKVAPKIKEKMMKQGTLMVAYQPLPSKGLKNFFRMVFHCVPEPSKEDVVFVLDEIERLGKDL